MAMLPSHGWLARRAARLVAGCCAAALAVLIFAEAAPAVAATTLYGYVATGATFTHVTGSWHVPKVTCTPAAATTAVWAGLDGHTSPTVEQIGTSEDCSGGTARYGAWYDLFPAPPVVLSHPVKPGDSISASVRASGSGTFTLKMTDATQGWAVSVTGHLSGAALSSAEAFFANPRCTAFTAIHFMGVTANGSPLGALSPVKVAGPCPITISPVVGSSFTVT
jgi:hypothetical protein